MTPSARIPGQRRSAPASAASTRRTVSATSSARSVASAANDSWWSLATSSLKTSWKSSSPELASTSSSSRRNTEVQLPGSRRCRCAIPLLPLVPADSPYDRAVLVVAAVLAGLAALLHVYIFVLESVRWRRPGRRRHRVDARRGARARDEEPGQGAGRRRAGAAPAARRGSGYRCSERRTTSSTPSACPAERQALRPARPRRGRPDQPGKGRFDTTPTSCRPWRRAHVALP